MEHLPRSSGGSSSRKASALITDSASFSCSTSNSSRAGMKPATSWFAGTLINGLLAFGVAFTGGVQFSR